jgi:hypothetical protein
MGLFDFVGNVLSNPIGTAVGAISALATRGPAGLLGVFNQQTVMPKAASNSIAVPQNSSGLGIFSQIANLTPIGTLFNAGVKQTVAFNPAVKTGLTTISKSVSQMVKDYGTPLPAGPAQTAQAAGLQASGTFSAGGSTSSGSNNTLLYIGGAALAAKLLKLW